MEQHHIDEADAGYAEFSRDGAVSSDAEGPRVDVAEACEPIAAMEVEEARVSGRERFTWLGRIAVVQAPWGDVLYIGPHWYCSVVMLCFILGIGFLYTYSLAALSGALHVLGGIAVTSISTLTFLQCVFANPGILKRQDAAAAESGEAGLLHAEDELTVVSSRPLNRRGRGPRGHCAKCNIKQPKGVSHCEFCEVCVLGHDHHCPWMGKCIGKRNLAAFHRFICIGFSSLGYIFVVTVLSAPEPPHHHRPVYH